MMHFLRICRSVPVLIVCVALAPAWARADIVGFGDFSQFTINQNDAGAAPSVFAGGIELTNPGANERRSVFHNTPQSIETFTATFTYQAANALRTNGIGYGATFALHNSPLGAAAVGTSATGFGYGDITPSAAVTLELRSGGDSRTGLFFDGTLGGGSVPTDPLDFFDTNPIDVTITYNGSLLTTSFKNTLSGDEFERSYIVDLPAILGGTTAYVGFTASTGAAGFSASAEQHFSEFQFTCIPEPSSLLSAVSATICFGCWRWRKTPLACGKPS